MKLLVSMAEFDEIVETGLELAKSKAAQNGLEFTEHEEVMVKIGLSCGIKALSDHILKKEKHGLQL